jgi:hypothetical protein
MIANPAIFSTGQSVTLEWMRLQLLTGPTQLPALFRGAPGLQISLLLVGILYVWNWPAGYSFIQFAKTAANVNFSRVLPYGSAVGADTKTSTYATTPAVREAAMILAVDIWQARQVSQTGGVTIDGFSPSPYRLGNSMIGKIRGMISGYTNPGAMVG